MYDLTIAYVFEGHETSAFPPLANSAAEDFSSFHLPMPFPLHTTHSRPKIKLVRQWSLAWV